MGRIIIIYIIVLFLSTSGFAQHGESILSQEASVEFKSPNAFWQSLAGGVIYSTSFFLLDGKNVLKNFDSLFKNTEYQPLPTLAVSSFFSALAVSIIGDLTATRNGGSYVSTLTIDWLASFFSAVLFNKIYSGNNQTTRFAFTLIPSVAVLVFMNQMYFDPYDKQINSFYGSSIFQNLMPIIGSNFVGIDFHKQF